MSEHDEPVESASEESADSSMDETTQDAEKSAYSEEERATLRAELEVLREENKRLRDEYARARKSEYRRTALMLGGIGLLAVFGGFFASGARTVLFALGGTALFIGVLTYYLTPERMLPATVGQDVYRALSTTQSAMIEELGLTEDRVYVPTGDEDGHEVRLYVPQDTQFEVPDDEALERVFVIGANERERGLSTASTGDRLFDRFEEVRTEGIDNGADALAAQLATALVEQFELVDGTDVESSEQQVTVAVTGSAYGRVDQFDHPVPSLLASGLARELDTPVEVTVERPDDHQADALIICRWGNGPDD